MNKSGFLPFSAILTISLLSASLISATTSASPYMFILEYNKESAPPISITRVITGKYPHTVIKVTKGGKYSYNSSSMKAMEEELKKLTATKIIKTPPVSHKTAMSPIIINANDEEESTSTPPKKFFQGFIKAALKRTESIVKYDGRYRYISYPGGDVPANRGVCTDVVIRSYRSLGIDLQQLVHEDIKDNFSTYPSRNKWGLTAPDTNIDHRRVYNLQVFFQRFGETLPITNSPDDYQPGDLVTWTLGPKLPHIGIVVDEYSEEDIGRPLIVHNIGQGPMKEDVLFSFPITGHYRYKPGRSEARTIVSRNMPVTHDPKKKKKHDALLEDAIQEFLTY